jgi:hypothetical protein
MQLLTAKLLKKLRKSGANRVYSHESEFNGKFKILWKEKPQW